MLKRSIIQLIERERNGFLKEEDYQIVNKEIAIMADHYKRQFFLLDYTSKIEKSLMIEYDQAILEKLFYSWLDSYECCLCVLIPNLLLLLLIVRIFFQFTSLFYTY